jgi:hypothetical protein
MKPRITQDDFEARARGRVARHYRIDFVAQVFHQHLHHYINFPIGAPLRRIVTHQRARARI